MLESKITFDRFIRWILVTLGVTAAVLLINRLSGVLLPFFVAWILAYLIYPFVCFLQHRCRLRNRVLSIVVAMLVVVSILIAVFVLIVPPIIQESIRMINLTRIYFQDTLVITQLMDQAQAVIRRFVNNDSLLQFVQQSSFVDAMKSLLIHAWNFLAGTVNIVMGILGCFIVILYMFFILMDYEKISQGWRQYIPASKRNLTNMIVNDLKNGMNAYFRGQALIALIVGFLCSVGFLIIDFPMAIAIGVFIGVLNLVPYLQLVGFIPITLLAVVEATETDRNFWVVLLSAFAVIGVVQLIQDLYLTPRIMGKVMGLKPAIILLSLSVWGSLLGVIGLIIALPLSTLLISYYRRFVLGETDETSQNAPEDEKKEAKALQ